MKNFIKTSTKCYNKTVTKNFSDQGFLINEITSETYTESDTIEPNQLPEQTNNSKWYSRFNKAIDLVLKVDGLISFCLHFNEPVFINFLILTTIGIGKILMNN